jgi:hypothetical protein
MKIEYLQIKNHKVEIQKLGNPRTLLSPLEFHNL